MSNRNDSPSLTTYIIAPFRIALKVVRWIERCGRDDDSKYGDDEDNGEHNILFILIYLASLSLGNSDGAVEHILKRWQIDRYVTVFYLKHLI